MRSKHRHLHRSPDAQEPCVTAGMSTAAGTRQLQKKETLAEERPTASVGFEMPFNQSLPTRPEWIDRQRPQLAGP